jgi:hypothetical protein
VEVVCGDAYTMARVRIFEGFGCLIPVCLDGNRFEIGEIA